MDFLQGTTTDSETVTRLEAKIRDLDAKLELEQTTRHRAEVVDDWFYFQSAWFNWDSLTRGLLEIKKERWPLCPVLLIIGLFIFVIKSILNLFNLQNYYLFTSKFLILTKFNVVFEKN